MGVATRDAPFLAAQYFGEISVGGDALLFHGLFMLLVIGIVALGVQRGIEVGVKLMVPAIILIFIGLAAYAITSRGPARPTVNTCPQTSRTSPTTGRAWSQRRQDKAFHALPRDELMITYASYLGDDENLAIDEMCIVVLNTGISILTGLIVFPVLFSADLDPASPSAGAIFVSVARAIGDVPMGQIVNSSSWRPLHSLRPPWRLA